MASDFSPFIDPFQYKIEGKHVKLDQHLNVPGYEHMRSQVDLIDEINWYFHSDTGFFNDKSIRVPGNVKAIYEMNGAKPPFILNIIKFRNFFLLALLVLINWFVVAPLAVSYIRDRGYDKMSMIEVLIYGVVTMILFIIVYTSGFNILSFRVLRDLEKKYNNGEFNLDVTGAEVGSVYFTQGRWLMTAKE